MNDDLDKQYYKIKEVAEMLGLPQSTLRFWEKELLQGAGYRKVAYVAISDQG